MEGAALWQPETGTPQGGPLSPLLANIYLNPLDWLLAGLGVEMVRYADRRVQAEIYEEIKDMTHEQEIAYFRRTANEGWIGEWWRSIKGDSQTVHENPPERVDDEE